MTGKEARIISRKVHRKVTPGDSPASTNVYRPFDHRLHFISALIALRHARIGKIAPETRDFVNPRRENKCYRQRRERERERGDAIYVTRYYIELFNKSP